MRESGREEEDSDPTSCLGLSLSSAAGVVADMEGMYES